MVERRLWAKGTALAFDFGVVVAALSGLPLASADFFRGFSAALVGRRLWAKGTALALDFGAAVAAQLGLPLVWISSFFRGLLCSRGFGVRGRRLISVLFNLAVATGRTTEEIRVFLQQTFRPWALGSRCT